MVHRGARRSTGGACRLLRWQRGGTQEPDEPEPDEEDPEEPPDVVPLSEELEALEAVVSLLLVSLPLVLGADAVPLPTSPDDFLA